MNVRADIKAEHPELQNKMILSEIGKRWRSLTMDDK